MPVLDQALRHAPRVQRRCWRTPRQPPHNCFCPSIIPQVDSVFIKTLPLCFFLTLARVTTSAPKKKSPYKPKKRPYPLGGKLGGRKFFEGMGTKRKGKMGPPETTCSPHKSRKFFEGMGTKRKGKMGPPETTCSPHKSRKFFEGMGTKRKGKMGPPETTCSSQV